MTTKEVAEKLITYSREGDWDRARNELYADNIISIEPDFAPMPRVEGIEAKKQKDDMFGEMVEEMHKVTVSEPLIAGDVFSVSMSMDSTMKGMGRTLMEEICNYEVSDGKIVKEQFFYSPHSQEDC